MMLSTASIILLIYPFILYAGTVNVRSSTLWRRIRLIGFSKALDNGHMVINNSFPSQNNNSIAVTIVHSVNISVPDSESINRCCAHFYLTVRCIVCVVLCWVACNLHSHSIFISNRN